MNIVLVLPTHLLPLH